MSSFLSEVDLDRESPVSPFGDNEGGNSLTENSKQYALVKHIDGDIVVDDIRSAKNLGDLKDLKPFH